MKHVFMMGLVGLLGGCSSRAGIVYPRSGVSAVTIEVFNPESLKIWVNGQWQTLPSTGIDGSGAYRYAADLSHSLGGDPEIFMDFDVEISRSVLPGNDYRDWIFWLNDNPESYAPYEGNPYPPKNGWTDPAVPVLDYVIEPQRISGELLYPVFNIPMESGWIEVELKASTNNFETLCYWYESLGTNETLSGSPVSESYAASDVADFDGWMMFCGYEHYIGVNPPEMRRWHRMRVDAPAWSVNIDNNFVVVMPSRTTRSGPSSWMRPDNPNLTWVFRRRDALGGEVNGDGVGIWHPIEPGGWRNARPMNIKAVELPSVN